MAVGVVHEGASSDRSPATVEALEDDLHGAPGVAVRGEVDSAAVPHLELELDIAIVGSAGAFVRAGGRGAGAVRMT